MNISKLFNIFIFYSKYKSKIENNIKLKFKYLYV